VASQRRFRNLRSDRVLDTRQIGAALRRLRRLAREAGPDELDIDETIDQSARNGGDIDLVFRPPRANQVKLLLLMDVGGSMDPHTELCERLFSATHAASHFRKFEYYFFHNCVYEQLYSNIAYGEGPSSDEVLRKIDRTWSVMPGWPPTSSRCRVVPSPIGIRTRRPAWFGCSAFASVAPTRCGSIGPVSRSKSRRGFSGIRPIETVARKWAEGIVVER
jgi:hypothetical protein